ncbi:iron-siderophore ABC transporter substrate-binding protein [Nocardioides korecus]
MKRLLIAALPLVLLTAACSTGPTGSGGSADGGGTAERAATEVDADAFPVTIEHAFGSTTIEREPTRVATLGWSDQDNALALGVVPVGATRMTWGGNAAGSSDWFDEEVEELGAKPPVRYDDADGAPLEDVARVRPDVILATNSGLTEAEYDKLSKIAPVVIYPKSPWATPWRTSLATVGKALGRTTEAEKVAAETQEEIDEARREHPELQGASMIFGYVATTDLSSIGIYSPQDPRVSFMHDLGLVDAPAVAKAVKPGQFYSTVSAERAPELRSDVFLTWAENARDLRTFARDRLIGKVPAIVTGHAYAEVDKPTALAVTNPTPLSIPTILDDFVPEVSAAVQGS